MPSTDLGGLETAVESVVLPVIQAHGLTLVDLELRGGSRRMVVRIYVDKAGGVTVGECQRLSHEVGDVIEVANLVPGSYDLEVSSPGLDRELRKDRELHLGGRADRAGLDAGAGRGSPRVLGPAGRRRRGGPDPGDRRRLPARSTEPRDQGAPGGGAATT